MLNRRWHDGWGFQSVSLRFGRSRAQPLMGIAGEAIRFVVSASNIERALSFSEWAEQLCFASLQS
jgi:hypothetical protein